MLCVGRIWVDPEDYIACVYTYICFYVRVSVITLNSLKYEASF